MTQWRKYWHSAEETRFIILAVMLGLGTAGFVMIFRQGIEVAHFIFRKWLGAEGIFGQALTTIGIDPRLSLILALALAGFIVGLIMHYLVVEEKYHGVTGIMEAVAISGGRLRYRQIPLKTLAAMISLGAGASVGPEDPSVQIGANLGSFLGDKLRLPEEKVKLIVAAGAASAIASAFNAPIAGVFFAMEVIMGEVRTTSFGVVVLSAVISSAFTQGIIGANPIFGDLDYVLGNPLQLPFFALLGVLLAFMSHLTIRFFHWQADVWHHQITIWKPLKTTLVGALIGVVGLFAPQILGTGEAFMHAALTGHIEETAIILIGLAFLKLLMTAISQGGGFVGGVFAPTLFIGIALGSAYGHILNAFIPSIEVGNPPSYAIAGMAGMLAGVVRAPLTAILLVFELTDDYTLILPIMLTAIVCTIIVDQIGPAGIYMWTLIKNGLHLHQGRDIDVMQGMLVRETMRTPAPIVDMHCNLANLRSAFHQQNARALCVIDTHQHLVGLVTLGDLQKAYDRIKDDDTLADKINTLTVIDICSQDVVTTHPDDVLWRVIQRMGSLDIGRLPVIDEDGHVVGLLRRQDVMTAYNKAITRKFYDQHYAEQIRLNTLTGAHVIEYTVRTESSVCNQQIQALNLPHEALIASILRKGKLRIPHGDTQLKAGDKVTIVTDAASEKILNTIF
ncbi:MAG: chloride channel protein [Phototrophicaceae bacterium]